MKSFYLAGSLRNPRIPEFANQIVAEGYEVFADWFNPGPAADDYHRDYARARGWSYRQFLEGPAAKNIFDFDKYHMSRCDALVLLMPAGKSAHLELGYTLGQGKPGYIVFEEEPERYEIMVQFATQIFFSRQEFLDFLKEKNNGNVR
jgi:nucleoside 2-deoxyribosyltransferase